MKNPLLWIPLNVDGWLFGSTRLELDPAQRSVFVDLLALAAKDDGYIRANESMPYPPSQLAGFLKLDEELLNSTIKKCLEANKLTQLPNGTLRVTSWDRYKLSERHRRRFGECGDGLQNPSEEEKSIVEYSKGKRTLRPQKRSFIDSPRENTSFSESSAESSEPVEKPSGKPVETRRNPSGDGYSHAFEAWWSGYPRKESKEDAHDAFRLALSPKRQEESPATVEELTAARDAYTAKVRERGTETEFIKLPATFLRKNRWRDYLPKPKPTPEEWEARQAAELRELNGSQGERR